MMQRLEQIMRTQFDVSESDLSEALEARDEKGGDIGEILYSRGKITEMQLLAARGMQYGFAVMEKIPLGNIRQDFTRKISIQFLKKYHMLPLEGLKPSSGDAVAQLESGASEAEKKTSGFAIAINDPADFQPLDDLCSMLGMEGCHVVLATKEEILAAINFAYDMGRDSAEQLVQNMEEDDGMILSEIESTADLLDDTSDAPIIKLVNHILSQSIKARASDIHIEPYQESFKVRYRVDGILYDLLTPPKWIQASLISRIKVMAKLNIAEKRLPQDGRLEVRIGSTQIDVRVSTIPTTFGERVVLRLLNKTSSLLKMTDLGLSAEGLERVKRLVSSPNGIILITGPTGSGKTTTLYAILSTLNSPDINIITIEDPIEYQINGISQIQVNPKIGLTFARGLRSIVRQDPDVVLVGEIRDHETAEIAVQSALTGHLVFSTLHTNDSAGAITRLVDIGIEPFLISSSVIAVVAQRLVRVLCKKCKEPYHPNETVLNNIGILQGEIGEATVFRARGCEHCINTGYRGRIGIFEILELESRLKSMILGSFDANRIQEEAVRQNLISLRRDGIRKVLDGDTTIEEVLRVTQK